ncbi:protein S100-A9 [Vombatus ursinus]|uniref:Protein S100-A9 n=1 Tax=Vombatus ursinus TaxID=29139 RepID=A0A4X2JMV2_VOMUR|nr:protein S100-A12-like [Vombatus ursinus]XP_027727162.1 protein S100-A9 [Vombatus ursinus]XP_027727163.1 protein S100-A9 [Vombatus ursinus]
MEACSLKNSLKIFVDTFHKYSNISGNKDALNRREMKTLLNKEMPHFIKNSKDLKNVSHLFEELDTNQDADVDFKEFAVMIARVVMETHEKMHENAPPGQGHSHGPGLEGPVKGKCGQ